MEQIIPNINDDDIKRIVSRDFPLAEFSEIEGILEEYKSESKKGRNRVYASIVKLSNGNIDSLKDYVEKAKRDYRDILSLSEFPNYSEIAFDDELSELRKEEIIKKDWKQYQDWLTKK